MQRPTIAEVDLSAIRDNIRAIRARVGAGVRIIPAVKANAYGHGAVPVSRACLEAGADVLGVAFIDEAIELREAGIEAPILVLGCSEPDVAEDIVLHEVAVTCCDPRLARALSDAAIRLGKTALVHVKVDTGMGRIGVHAHEAIDFVRFVASLPNLSVGGIFTHFPSSDEPDRVFTLSQIGEFRKIVSELGSPVGPGVNPRTNGRAIAHASNSGGILAYPEADFDAVRPGITVYGCYPSNDVPHTIPIREALTLKSRIVFLKEAPVGATISYGRTHAVERKSLVATLPIGYADGYSRLLSNQGEAAIRGARVPVIGRVCMDQIMIDVTDIPGAQVGDEVILYGGGYDYLSVTAIADKIGTISYEVFCNIGARVPRVYLNV